MAVLSTKLNARNVAELVRFALAAFLWALRKGAIPAGRVT